MGPQLKAGVGRLPLAGAVLLLTSVSAGATGGADAGVEPVRFVDVAAEAGLNLRYVNGASGQNYMPEPMGSGVAFFDADGDGGLDLYIINGGNLPGHQVVPAPANALYRNLGDGTFADVTSAAAVGDTAYGMGAAVGDYDNDGDADPGWGANAAFVDYDNDGDLDLYVANYMEYDLMANRAC